MRKLVNSTPTRSLRTERNGAVPRLPYPNGWFAVAFCDELPVGRVLTRPFMGESIVLYRTSSGLLRAIRPYCPHLGAHLGYGGRVDGEDIVCPFHNFAFSPTGACVRTGYGTPPPPNARLAALEMREVDGVILVWRHAQDCPPDWEIPPTMPEGFCPKHIVRTLVTHPQEICENAVDTGHFAAVHKMVANTYQVGFTGPVIEINMEASLIAGSRSGFLDHFGSNSIFQLHGLGWIFSRFNIPKLGLHVKLWMLPTPIDPLHLEVRIAGNVERFLGHELSRPVIRLFSKVVVSLSARDFAQDAPIWNNKTYVELPKLAKGDGPIMEFRRWAKQFYSTDVPDD